MHGRQSAVSFEKFVQARSGSLLRTALLLTGQHRAEAEDLLQLALERACRHWARVCDTGEPERYVRRILGGWPGDPSRYCLPTTRGTFCWRGDELIAAVTGVRRTQQVGLWQPGRAGCSCGCCGRWPG